MGNEIVYDSSADPKIILMYQIVFVYLLYCIAFYRIDKNKCMNYILFFLQ